MKILITGGAGYIGSHTAVELVQAGHEVIVIDNFSNSNPESIERVEQITGAKITLYTGDVCDKSLLKRIFSEHSIDAAIHFAGLKAVGESVKKPLEYYRNNIDTSLALCEVMSEKSVKKLIFSSSATVYGYPEKLPLKETSRAGQNIPNPYGQIKYMIEQILSDLVNADPQWQITTLRYFNPVGAHPSGRIGEDPRDTPNNLMPYISQVAIGKLSELSVYGDDYDTPDGTGVRDYIHVVDLAKGHVAALQHMKPGGQMEIYNLGAGKGISVLEAVHAFEKASGKTIPYKIVGRRKGDVPSCYADARKAQKELNWHTDKTIDDICTDSWRWQSQNPNGYLG